MNRPDHFNHLPTFEDVVNKPTWAAALILDNDESYWSESVRILVENPPEKRKKAMFEFYENLTATSNVYRFLALHFVKNFIDYGYLVHNFRDEVQEAAAASGGTVLPNLPYVPADMPEYLEPDGKFRNTPTRMAFEWLAAKGIQEKLEAIAVNRGANTLRRELSEDHAVPDSFKYMMAHHVWRRLEYMEEYLARLLNSCQQRRFDPFDDHTEWFIAYVDLEQVYRALGFTAPLDGAYTPSFSGYTI